MTTIFVFGNPDLPLDSLPIRMISFLKNRFPNLQFCIKDPNELDLPSDGDELTVLDVVKGLKNTRWISIDELAKLNKNVTAHDFDLTTYLLLVHKMKKDVHIRILGVPMGGKMEDVRADVERYLAQL